MLSPIDHTNPLSVASREVEEICRSLNSLTQDKVDRMFTRAGWQQVESKISNTVKLLKRSMKGEEDISKLQQIHSLLSKVKTAYEGVVQKQTPSRSETIKEIGLLLSQIQKCEARALKRIEVLKNRSTLAQPVLRLDRWIETLPKQINRQTILFIVDRMQLKSGMIIEEDLEDLNGVRTQIEAAEDFEQKQELASFVDSLINQIENTQKNQKQLVKNLVKNLNEELKEHQGVLTDEMKVKYVVQFRQITNNPFEIKIKNEYSAFKKLIPDHFMLEIPYSTKTAEYKLQGLKRIREQAQKTPQDPKENLLISGAGPGGLMLALASALQNKEFLLIEARGKQEPMRENIIVLENKQDPSRLPMLMKHEQTGRYREGELKLLDFLGVTDHLIANKKIIEEPRGRSLSVRIKDLQEAMIHQLMELKGEKEVEQLIHYDTEIASIRKHGEDLPVTVAFQRPARSKQSSDSLLGPATPSLVHVMEGYHSKTRGQLGVDLIKESKAARMAFSFFKKQDPRTLGETLQVFINVLRTVPDTLKLVWGAKLFSPDHKIEEVEVVFHALGRGEVVLKTSDSQYFYSTLTKEEVERIKQYEEHLAAAHAVVDQWVDSLSAHLSTLPSISLTINTLSSLESTNRKNTLENQEKRQLLWSDLRKIAEAYPSPLMEEKMRSWEAAIKLFEEADKQWDRLEEEMKVVAEKGRQRFNLIEDSTIDRAEYSSMQFGASQVQKAEANYRTLGHTAFYIGGDAETTTDPVSGAGMRTTFLRTSLAASALEDANIRHNPFMQSAFAWTSHLIGRSMREEGLHVRRAYAEGTERLERYLSIAEDAGVLTVEERNLMLRIEGKIKSLRGNPALGLQLSEDDKRQLNKIKENLFTAFHDVNRGWARLPWQDSAKIADIGWTPQEMKIFKLAYDAAVNEKKIDDPSYSVEIFKKAAAKAALYRGDTNRVNFLKPSQFYVAEAWFVVVSTLIDETLSSN